MGTFFCKKIFHLKSNSFWVSPLPKPSSFYVSPLPGSCLCSARKLGHPKRAGFRKRDTQKELDLGSGDMQKELDLGSGDTQKELNFKWKYHFIYIFCIIFFLKTTQTSKKCAFNTRFECWRTRPPPFKWPPIGWVCKETWFDRSSLLFEEEKTWHIKRKTTVLTYQCA